MGLVILFFIALYVAVLVATTVLPYRFGLKQGWTRRKRRLAAAVGFLLIFLPMFWDWIPTVWLHSYYCEKYGDLTINKTPEQWKLENPDVATTLVRQKPPLQVGAGDKYYFQLSQRFRWEIEYTDKLLGIGQREDRVVDGKTGEVMARNIDFWTVHSVRSIQTFRDVKIWMNRNSCQTEGKMVNAKRFSRIEADYASLGEQQ
jgi:hypothetical protein